MTDFEDVGEGQKSLRATHPLKLMIITYCNVQIIHLEL